jgi:predicted Zn-dependent protease
MPITGNHIIHSLLLALLLLGMVDPGPGGMAMAMTEAEELEIGKAAHQQILQQYRVYNNQDLQKYVQFIGQKLAEKSSRPNLNYSFLILDSADVNAFALPGGYIYVTRGLMAYLNSEAELAAVLGHEVGHVAARHSAKQDTAAKLTDFGTKLAAILGSLYVPGLDPNISSDLLGVGGNALLKGYGRDHELEADALGAEYMVKSGYDVHAMLDVITTLKNQENYEFRLARLEGREPRIYHGLFATHPSNDQRLQEAVANAGKLVSDAPVYTGTDTYLNLINGMSFGTDVRQGLVVDSNFYHGPLGYALRFPDGWNVDNKANAVLASNRTNSALIQISYMSADRRSSPGEYMQNRLGMKSLRDSQALSINNLPAHTGQVVVNSPYGRRLARVTVIYFGSRAIILSCATREPDGINRYDRVCMDAARSLRPMSRQERLAAAQQKIRIIRAHDTVTYKALAAESPLHNLAEEQLRLLNGDYPAGEPVTGATIKIIQ